MTYVNLMNAAAHVGVTKRTIQNWIVDEKLSVVHRATNGPCRLVNLEDVEWCAAVYGHSLKLRATGARLLKERQRAQDSHHAQRPEYGHVSRDGDGAVS